MVLRRGIVLLLGLMLLFAVGCKKDVVAPPPPPPPPPEPDSPTVTLRAQPSVIDQGQSATLSWNSTNATDLTLNPGPGSVGPEGSQSVSPETSTTYTLSATGPGGTEEATARVTVNIPPPPPPPAPTRPTAAEAFGTSVSDAYFDFDRADIRSDASEALTRTAEFLREYPEARVLVEGHCDERGSTEYNIQLGDRRAQAVRDFLQSLGIAPGRLQVVSYGEERPFCNDATEGCWQQNRRGHFVLLP